jgi:hypothetical protein
MPDRSQPTVSNKLDGLCKEITYRVSLLSSVKEEHERLSSKLLRLWAQTRWIEKYYDSSRRRGPQYDEWFSKWVGVKVRHRHVYA